MLNDRVAFVLIERGGRHSRRGPCPRFLRLTVKGLGDYSSAVARLQPGTRVAVEGPYGAFTNNACCRTKVALIAGGIGVTAIRSLLEDLPRRSAIRSSSWRASTPEELVLSAEVSELVRARKGRVHEPQVCSAVRIDKLAELIPDLRLRDVYVSRTRDGFVQGVVADPRTSRGPEGLRPLRGVLTMSQRSQPSRGHAGRANGARKMRRVPAVLAASAAGFAGVLAMHQGSRATVLGGAGPSPSPTSSSTDHDRAAHWHDRAAHWHDRAARGHDRAARGHHRAAVGTTVRPVGTTAIRLRYQRTVWLRYPWRDGHGCRGSHHQRLGCKPSDRRAVLSIARRTSHPGSSSEVLSAQGALALTASRALLTRARRMLPRFNRRSIALERDDFQAGCRQRGCAKRARDRDLDPEAIRETGKDPASSATRPRPIPLSAPADTPAGQGVQALQTPCRKLWRRSRRTWPGRHPAIAAAAAVVVLLTPVWGTARHRFDKPGVWAVGSGPFRRMAARTTAPDQWSALSRTGGTPTMHLPSVGVPRLPPCQPCAGPGPSRSRRHTVPPCLCQRRRGSHRLHTPPSPARESGDQPGRLVRGAPAVYETFLRPDAVHTSIVDGIAWLDTKLLSATLYSGSYIPGGGPYKYTAPVQPSAAGSLVAAFNAGFRMQDANGGYFTQGKVIIPLRSGAASFVIYRNGTATVGVWGSDVTMSSRVVAVRQNLNLLVDNGRPVPGLNVIDTTQWGNTLGNQIYVSRSGVGVDA